VLPEQQHVAVLPPSPTLLAVHLSGPADERHRGDSVLEPRGDSHLDPLRDEVDRRPGQPGHLGAPWARPR
jgi:hypothetical protein